MYEITRTVHYEQLYIIYDLSFIPSIVTWLKGTHEISWRMKFLSNWIVYYFKPILAFMKLQKKRIQNYGLKTIFLMYLQY